MGLTQSVGAPHARVPLTVSSAGSSCSGPAGSQGPTGEGPGLASSASTRAARLRLLLRQLPVLPPQVKRSRSKGGLAGPDGTKSVFGQMCAKMSSFSPDSLLLPHRVWKVKFVGESLGRGTGSHSGAAAPRALWGDCGSLSFPRR